MRELLRAFIGTAQSAIDALAFDTLIPKANVQRLINQLLDQKRLILCGSVGTGKSYLARKLAEYLTVKSGRHNNSVDHVTLKADDADKVLIDKITVIGRMQAQEQPTVILIDNLQVRSFKQNLHR